jgi:hypothetical protein
VCLLISNMHMFLEIAQEESGENETALVGIARFTARFPERTRSGVGPTTKGFLGNDISMRVGDRMPRLAPAPSLGVSFGHGVRSRSPAAGPSPIAGVDESSAGGVRQRTRRDYCATDCESDARRDRSRYREVSRRCYRTATTARLMATISGYPHRASHARGVHVELWDCGRLAPEFQ